MNKYTAAIGWAFMLFILFATAEVASYVALGSISKLRQYIYTTPNVTEETYGSYLEKRDPELGWPSKGWYDTQTDERGARLSPANAALGDTTPCVSLYGDSFTFSDEVADNEAWGDVLARHIGCRVDNFGVGGFGTDQALLRMERHVAQDAALGDVVILSLYPDNLNRIVNQWRHLLSGNQPLGFKPVFAAGPGGVELQPLFTGDFAAYEALTLDPSTYLTGESYLPEAQGFSRQMPKSFPYSLTLLRVAQTIVSQIRSFDAEGYKNLINYPGYYDSKSGVNDNKVEITRFIINRFADLCAAESKKCGFMLIPDLELVFQMSRGGEHDLGWVLEAAQKRLLTLDATTVFAGPPELCASLTNPDACHGHFNPTGYSKLAGYVLDSLQKEGWLPATSE